MQTDDINGTVEADVVVVVGVVSSIAFSSPSTATTTRSFVTPSTLEILLGLTMVLLPWSFQRLAKKTRGTLSLSPVWT
jgi:hydrogenase/urease accessory protein HupE